MDLDLDWLDLSRWILATYPGHRVRENRVFAHLVEGLDDQEQANARHALRAMVRGPKSAGDLQGLQRYVERVRRAHPDPRLEQLEFMVTMIDAAHRLGTANPFVDAVESMGWSRVPVQYASMAVELGILVCSRVRIRALASSIPMAEFADSMDDHEGDEFALMGFSGDEGWKDLFGVDGGLDPEPDPLSMDPAGRLAMLVDRIAGAPPRLDGRPDPSFPVVAALRASRIRSVPGYLLEMLERLPRTEPRCLEVYELIADTAEDSQLSSSERATEVFVRATGSAQLAAHSKLRAVVRRFFRDQPEEAVARGLEAFHAMSELDERAGACLAASVLSHPRVQRGDASPIEWLERAVTLARDHEHPLFQMLLLGPLLDAHREAKDELGIRRVTTEMQALARRHTELCDLAEPGLEREPSTGQSLSTTAAPADLHAVQRFIDEGRVGEGYEALNDHLGELLESHPLEALVERLADYVQHDMVHGVLEAWCCAAIAELVDDDEQWSVYKLRQLTIEDRVGLTETMLDAGFDYVPSGLGELDDMEEDGDRPQRLDPRGRAAHCIVEAEQALGNGAPARARFWATRAQFYRDRINA